MRRTSNEHRVLLVYKLQTNVLFHSNTKFLCVRYYKEQISYAVLQFSLRHSQQENTTIFLQDK